MTMFAIGIPLFFAAQTEQGAAGIIRHALGDIQLAVQEYQKYKGENAWYIDVEGRSNTTVLSTHLKPAPSTPYPLFVKETTNPHPQIPDYSLISVLHQKPHNLT